jgi:hypothetical protein
MARTIYQRIRREFETFLRKSAKSSGPNYHRRHCEERSDEAIQPCFAILDCFASLAMTGTGQQNHSAGRIVPSTSPKPTR